MRIGFFDSGFGGLSIMREVVKALPEYDYVYLGDNLHVPYGPRSAEEVRRFTTAAVDFLFSKGCQLVVIACNTATAQALAKIQKEYLPSNAPDRRVLGVLLPAAEEAAQLTNNKRVGVIATQGTVDSGVFVRELVKQDARIEVYQQACPEVVTLVENGEHDSPQLREALGAYLKPLIGHGIDTLILGSTHYSLVATDVQKVVGPNVKLVDEGPVVAQKLADYLKRKPEINNKLTRGGTAEFYCTKPSEHFDEFGTQFYGATVKARLAVLSAAAPVK